LGAGTTVAISAGVAIAVALGLGLFVVLATLGLHNLWLDLRGRRAATTADALDVIDERPFLASLHRADTVQIRQVRPDDSKVLGRAVYHAKHALVRVPRFETTPVSVVPPPRQRVETQPACVVPPPSHLALPLRPMPSGRLARGSEAPSREFTDEPTLTPAVRDPLALAKRIASSSRRRMTN
jgi:hypothetical protein